MPKIVISNTTPLITLLGVKRFDLFEALYQNLMIPEAVYWEVEAGKDKLFYTDLKKYEWLSIEKVKNQDLVRHLCTFLDKGEAEAIVLAEEKHADLLLLDERVARNYANLKGLNCSGSWGVLLKAKDLGLIEAIKPLLETAQKNGIRLSKKLIDQILTEAKE